MRSFIGIAAVIAAALSGSLASAQTVLTTSAWGPPHHPAFSTIAQWGEKLEKDTEGRIKLHTLPAAPVPANETVNAVRNGLQDIGIIVHAYNPGRFVLTGIAELPFLGDTAEAMSVAYQRVYERHLAAANEHQGLVVLSVFTHGPGQILNTKHPVDSIDDLSRLKWRVGGGASSEAAKLLGTTGFLKPAPESYELLSSGIADGIFFPLEGVVSYRLDELISHVTIVPGGFYNISWAMIMNKERFEGLSPSDQEALLRLTGENFSRAVGKAWDAGDKKGLEALKKAGAQIRTASPDFVAEIKEQLAPMEARWIEAASERGVDGAAALRDFRAELERLDAR